MRKQKWTISHIRYSPDGSILGSTFYFIRAPYRRCGVDAYVRACQAAWQLAARTGVAVNVGNRGMEVVRTVYPDGTYRCWNDRRMRYERHGERGAVLQAWNTEGQEIAP